MTHSIRRYLGLGFVLASGAAAIVACSPQAFAQTPPPPSEPAASTDETRIAIVKGHDVYVRCGAAESYYTFTKLNDGDTVKVTGTKYEWSRVVTAGPAFDSAFGYIKFTKGDTTRFRMAADGKSGVTLGKIDIIAPNLDSKNNPKDSWKSLVKLDADQALRVIESTDSDKETIVKVELPESATGWVSTTYLETATPEQSQKWTEMLANHAKAKQEAAKAAAKPAPAHKESSKPAASSNKTETPQPAAKPDKSPTDTVPAENSTEPAFAPVSAETNEPILPATDSTTPASPEVKAPEPKRLPGWSDLESALKRLQREPIETAEVGPLRELYLDLAQRSVNDERTARYANGRADQLQVWADIQKKRSEVDAIRQKAKMTAEETIAVQKALERSAEYVAVGRVSASTIYDGKDLPKLLRLQDASTGRTVCYLQPDEQYEIVNLIGNLVGIVGEKNYDGALRLNIVEPKRIDLLTPEAHQSGVTDQPRPE